MGTFTFKTMKSPQVVMVNSSKSVHIRGRPFR